MVIAFFGHANFAATDGLAQKMLVILDGILKDGRAEFYLGGYGGFDHFAYQCCKKYKATHPAVSLLLILPYIPTRYRQEDLEEKKAQYDELIYPELEMCHCVLQSIVVINGSLIMRIVSFAGLIMIGVEPIKHADMRGAKESA